MELTAQTWADHIISLVDFHFPKVNNFNTLFSLSEFSILAWCIMVSLLCSLSSSGLGLEYKLTIGLLHDF